MPDVGNINSVVVKGRYLNFDGNAVAGQVIFTPATPVADAKAGAIILVSSKSVQLRQDGSFEVELLATDDPDGNPTGFTYKVEEKLPSGRTYDISVPLSSPIDPATNKPTLQLASVAPAPAASLGTANYVTLTTFQAFSDDVSNSLLEQTDLNEENEARIAQLEALVTLLTKAKPSATGTPTLALVGTTGVTVTFAAATDPDGMIDHYEIERATNAVGPWSKIADMTGAGSYDDTGLNATTTYHYRVIPRSADSRFDGPYSSPANITTGAPQVGTNPGPPTNLSATSVTAGISLAWTAPTNNGGSAISGYRIDRSVDGSTWAYLTFKGGGAVTYTDPVTDGKRYYYRVWTKNSANKTSDWSNVASAVANGGNTQPPPGPTGDFGGGDLKLFKVFDWSDVKQLDEVTRFQGHGQWGATLKSHIFLADNGDNGRCMRLAMKQETGEYALPNGTGWYGARFGIYGFSMKTGRVVVRLRFSAGEKVKNSFMHFPKAPYSWPGDGEWDWQEIWDPTRQNMELTLHKGPYDGSKKPTHPMWRGNGGDPDIRADFTKFQTLKCDLFDGLLTLSILQPNGTWKEVRRCTDNTFIKPLTEKNITGAIAHSSPNPPKAPLVDSARQACNYDIDFIYIYKGTHG